MFLSGLCPQSQQDTLSETCLLILNPTDAGRCSIACPGWQQMDLHISPWMHTWAADTALDSAQQWHILRSVHVQQLYKLFGSLGTD